jgi:hypothetical protein
LPFRPDDGTVVLEVGKDFAMIDQAVERFERQLTHQIVGFRDDILEGEAALHTELRVVEASLRAEIAACRAEIHQQHAALRLEMRDLVGASVRETATLASTLRKEMADRRVWLFKWSFAFWLGQFIAFGGLMTMLLRALSP